MKTKRYYFQTKSSGKCGCASYKWRKTEKYSSKAELKRRVSSFYGRVITVYTEEQASEHIKQIAEDFDFC